MQRPPKTSRTAAAPRAEYGRRMCMSLLDPWGTSVGDLGSGGK